MARYIDADKIHEFVDTKVAEGKDGWAKGVPYEWAYALTVIDMQPTADVVPKSEYDRLLLELKATEERSESRKEADITEVLEQRLKVDQIFEEIDNALHDMAMEYYNARHPEYFAVCEMVHHKVVRPIEKKYTEDKQ